MSQGLLSHLRILDCSTGVAGPYSARLLAGFGAATWKLEPPVSGDPQRQRGPFFQNRPGLEHSLSFHWLNSGKRSITLDLENPQAAPLFRVQIASADILIESFTPGFLETRGFGFQALQELNPGLIQVSISPFGQTGPRKHWKATEIVHYAMSGGMSLTGDSDRPPLNSGPAIASYTAGLHAYLGALVALQRRQRDGVGEWVDVSIQESALENVEVKLIEALIANKESRRNGDSHPLIPWECYPTADGIAAIIGGPLRNWQKAAEALGDPELSEPPLHSILGRNNRRQFVHERVVAALADKSKRDIYHRGQQAGLAFGYLAGLEEAMEWEQHQSRQFLQLTEPHPIVGRLTTLAAPFHPHASSWRVGRAPLLGEHNDVIYGELGYSSDAIKALETSGVI